MAEHTSNTIAVFDLDGTLSRRDTYLPFLFGILGRMPGRFTRLLGLPWNVLLYKLKMIDNTELKKAFLRAFAGQLELRFVEAYSQTFVRNLMRDGLREQGMAALKWHQLRGARTVLLSASLDIYVEPLANALGLDEVFCTKADWRENKITGELATPNHYGLEKVKRLKQLRERFPNYRIIAYADHSSDIPMLLCADEAYLVNPTRKLIKQAGGKIQFVEWTR